VEGVPVCTENQAEGFRGNPERQESDSSSEEEKLRKSPKRKGGSGASSGNSSRVPGDSPSGGGQPVKKGKIP